MTLTEFYIYGLDVPEVDELQEFEPEEEVELFDTESYVSELFDCIIERYDGY